jgi:hypothetical protein
VTTLKLWWLRATRHLNAIADDLGHRAPVIWIRTLPARVWAFMKRRPFRLWLTFVLAYVAGWMITSTDEHQTIGARLGLVAITVALLFGHGMVSGRLEAEHKKTVLRTDSLKAANGILTEVVESYQAMVERFQQENSYPNNVLNAVAHHHLAKYPGGRFDQEWVENGGAYQWATTVGDDTFEYTAYHDDQVVSAHRALESFTEHHPNEKALTQ